MVGERKIEKEKGGRRERERATERGKERQG